MTPASSAPLTAAAVARILAYVGARTGLIFSPARHAAAEAAIVAERRRCARSWDEYERLLATRDDTFDALVDAITIGESYFFRDTPQLDVLRREVLPEIATRRPGESAIRMWSAGCACGEEPYSLAILAHEQGLDRRTHVLGTDLSATRLAAAVRARYGRWSLRGMDEETIERHFRRRDTQFELLPQLRALVHFEQLNLADLGRGGASSPREIDLVLCRNVLIYVDAETVARVVRALFGALAPHGWLLLGASDPVVSDFVDCEVVMTTAGLAYRPRRGVSGRTALPPASATVGPALAEAASECTVGGNTVSRPSAARDGQASDAPAIAMSTCDTSAIPETVAPLLEEAARAHDAAQYADAVRHARRYLALGGAEARAWVLLVRALANDGALAEAGKACAAAMERHPLSAELAYLHAVLLTHADRHEESAAAARRAVYLDRTLSVAHVVLGDALSRIGDNEGARRAYRTAERLLSATRPGSTVSAAEDVAAARLGAAVAARLVLRGDP